jgi:Phosphoadenosine phosphosulfate reductase family
MAIIRTRRMQEKDICDNNIPGKNSYVLSYGGGINSTALMIYLVENDFPLDHAIFADTGNELPETYVYLKHAKNYLQRHKIPFEIVMVRNQETLYEKCERRRVIPSQIWRWCTRDFKVLPIYRFYRSLDSHIYQYIGIDYDEFQRIKDSKVEYVTNIYPLVDYKIGREKCIEIIKNAGMPVPSKSGCFFCPFNNIERWYYLYKKYPELYNLAMNLEENGKHMPQQKLTLLPLRSLKKKIMSNQSLPNFKINGPCGSECMT